MPEKKYRQIENFLKGQIQKGVYGVGDYLPSENDLCKRFQITRTTARKALDELIRNGFIEKQHGKGSYVIERRKSLGLLAVKGFSEAAGEKGKTRILQKPNLAKWSSEIQLKVEKKELSNNCLFFERLRFIGNDPVMLEKNWFPEKAVPDFTRTEFTEGSFFKTLSQVYRIEITGSESELRAEHARKEIAELLNVSEGAPVLHISVKFYTSSSKLHIYSELYCNTQKFPIGNSYFL